MSALFSVNENSVSVMADIPPFAKGGRGNLSGMGVGVVAAAPPSMKMLWRYRANGAWLAPPRKIGPSWLVQVHRISLAKPKTNSCARPRKAGQWPHPLRGGHRSSTCSLTRFMPIELHLSSPTRPGTFKQAFPAFAKRPGAPSPPETNSSPGWLAQRPVAPAPPMGASRGAIGFSR